VWALLDSNELDEMWAAGRPKPRLPHVSPPDAARRRRSPDDDSVTFLRRAIATLDAMRVNLFGSRSARASLWLRRG
jgi:hypothetical protein